MGNRASIVFYDGNTDFSPAVYLHWNGGPESIYPMLDYLAARGGMGNSPSYSAARFAQIAGNFMGGTLSVGVNNGPRSASGMMSQADGMCQGAYLVGPPLQTDDPANPPLIPREPEPYSVRRFTRRAEICPAKVAEEKAAAYRHPYSTGPDTIAARLAMRNDPAFTAAD